METSYFLQKDFEVIDKWQKLRGLNLTCRAGLPSTGLVVLDDNEPIACGFLRKCEGNLAIIDSVITNPELSLKKRSKAIDILFERLIELSKEFGIDQIVGITTKSGMIKKSKKHGFIESNYKLMTLKVRD